jgi:hypothetical protein
VCIADNESREARDAAASVDRLSPVCARGRRKGVPLTCGAALAEREGSGPECQRVQDGACVGGLSAAAELGQGLAGCLARPKG